jgi:putative ABC transport system substrate-binding protein
VDGRNVAIELRYAQRGPQQLPELAAELVRMKVDVICASGDLAPKIAQQATATTPIVSIADDMLGAKLVVSLSRPEANITGLTILAPELSAKRVEVLKNILPGLSRIAAFWDPTTGASQVTVAQNAGEYLNLNLQISEVRNRDDLASAFDAATKQQAQALIIFSSPSLASLYREIIALAAKHRLPAIYQWREHVEAGGLASYGANLAEIWQQLARIVAKVLAGARPNEIPVEQPARFELVINQNTAKTLGLELPLALLIRADDVLD